MRFLHLRLLVSSLSVCLSVALACGANAGQKVDIYRTDTLVKSQSERERNAAARTTFGQLIVRVSGQTSALEHPAIKAALPKAENYLFGFSYKSSAEKITVDGKTFPAVGLQLNYEPLAIEQLLRESQLPLWPAIRPKVLVWLVAKDPTGLRLVPELTDLQAMQMQAEYRGLPLVFPKLDLEDTLSLSANDLWELNREKIAAASLRYKADAILVGRYTPSSMGVIPAPVIPEEQIDDLIDAAYATSSSASSSSVTASSSQAGDNLVVAEPIPGPWMGDWQLLHEASDQSFADETPEIKGLFVAAIDHAADYFAHQYAIMPTNQGPQTIVLHVGNITSFGAFKQVQAYLSELAMVQRMEVMQVNAEGLRVRLTTEGDARLLMSTLALGRRLAPLQSESLTDPLAQTPMVAAPADDQELGSIDPATAEGIDADAMAELDQALANEQIPGITPEPQALETAPVYGGTVENPLMYVWQK
ncbi:DUF2066 domain-containing protein [Cellvibrio sp. OA-2007]|uniref:DUF2066 domain-containing protein n=1 Tax=Cellvibrio sp. OA-2007 TaxID=529823 RepID=UPI000A493C66|nr:DUF2066 domain-containing protein [Cellvibrio sp. OA-2007]